MYKSVFGGDFIDGIRRMGELPPQEGQSPLAEEDKNLVMHVALPILGGHILMGTDSIECMGYASLVAGNNVYINLQPDTREETDRLFKALSDGGIVEMEPMEMFWGDYYGSCTDKFDVQWMLNCSEK